MEYLLLLLRGINVGGNHRVPMAELRGQLADAGLTDVVSYINSGNLIFTGSEDHDLVNQQVKTVLAENYDWTIPFTTLTQPVITELIDNAPEWWGEREDWRHNALFKLDGYAADYDQIVRDKMTLEYDLADITPHVIFWSSPAKVHYSRAFYAKMLNEPFYPEVSIRNRNTTLKLAQMMKDE